MLNYFAKLENPSLPLLGPNVKVLQFWGLLLPEHGYKRYFYIFVHTFITLFVLTTYIDLWFVKDDLNLILYNLKISLLGTISCCKVWTFLVWQKYWCSVIEYVTRADIANRNTEHPGKQKLISSYTKYSRKITLYYILLLFATVTIVVFQPFITYFTSATYRENVKNGTESYIQVVSSWVPFDKNTVPGYLAACFFQILGTIYGGGWITSYDCNAYVLMVFIKAELELLRIDSAEIFGTEESPVSDEAAVNKIRECHKRHVDLIKNLAYNYYFKTNANLEEIPTFQYQYKNVDDIEKPIIMKNDWWSVIDYVTKADKAVRNTDDPRKLNLITSYSKYSQKITIFYCMLMYATVLTLVFPPFFKYVFSPTYRVNTKNGTEPYMPVLSSWVPFDKRTLSGYVATSCFQTLSSIYGSGWITSYDCNAFVSMVFVKAELELLRIDCGEIFGTDKSPVTDEVALKRLKECHRRHAELIKYVRILDSCLSPNMLLYMFICSVMLCVTTYQITAETSLMKQFMTAEYLIFGIAQLFIYCWHSTDVFYASLNLSHGPYESLWWTRSASLKKNIYIMTAQFRQPVIFTAGPFTALTMTTYINILKGSYSYYTLLRNSQM